MKYSIMKTCTVKSSCCAMNCPSTDLRMNLTVVTYFAMANFISGHLTVHTYRETKGKRFCDWRYKIAL